MKMKSIRPIAGGLVQVSFDCGAIRVGEDELLDRSRFLCRVREQFRGRGIDDAPAYQNQWQSFIHAIWHKSNPQIFSDV